jgi:DNA-binding NarL/FixJ family response regulator
VTQQLAEFFPNYALTPREVEVLRLVAGGLGNREIGHQLGTASGTVKAHVQSILSKLGAKDRTHAVSIAVRRGIIHLNEPECELKTTR